MIAFATLLVGSGLVINVADTVARYDLKPTCRAAVNLAAGTEGRTIESCMAGEETAQKQLAKDRSRAAVEGARSGLSEFLCVRRFSVMRARSAL